jgi:hypothetical protein
MLLVLQNVLNVPLDIFPCKMRRLALFVSLVNFLLLIMLQNVFFVQLDCFRLFPPIPLDLPNVSIVLQDIFQAKIHLFVPPVILEKVLLFIMPHFVHCVYLDFIRLLRG